MRKPYLTSQRKTAQQKTVNRDVIVKHLLTWVIAFISASSLTTVKATAGTKQTDQRNNRETASLTTLNSQSEITATTTLLAQETNTAQATNTEAEYEDAEILVIHSYHSSFSWTEALKEGIEQGFAPNVTIHHEYLDSKRYPELLHQKEFLEHIRSKYKNTQLSALMVSDDPGMALVLANREQYFSDLPIVFMGVNNVQEELINKDWLTGVFENHNNAETIVEAARQNQADNIIIISDSTETGKATLDHIQIGLTQESNPPNLIVIEDLVTSEIDENLGDYPDHWPIFLAGQLRESAADGSLVSFEQETPLIQAQVPNPIYANTVLRLGNGLIGGKLLDGQYHAQQAVQLVELVLSGKSISEIEPVLQAKNQWMFDAQALESANIDINDIPSDSVLINVQPSFYEQYRSLVWGALTVFASSIVTITVLSYAISRQKHAERLLRENEKQLENRVETRTAELRETLEQLQKTQAQLIQTEKMSSLGQLVGGVAHELNNPLTFFSGNINCIEQYCQDAFSLLHLYQQQQSKPSKQILDYREEIDIQYIEQDMPKVFKSIRGGAERIQNIVSSLQAFSRADETGTKPTDINQSLESTVKILNPQLSQEIEINKSYNPLPPVTCNPGEINQVFLSILTNALDAMKTETNQLKQICISTSTTSENFVRISIKDTGAGIPQIIQPKVFDPFFTTKPIGQGTGLGLALAYQIVKKHKGHILFSSDGENGTEFMIDLPIG